MKTKQLKSEMNKKRDEVIKEIETRKNKEVCKATGLSPGYISDIKAGEKKLLKGHEKLLNIAERLGI